jgi:AhpC/TSA family/Copper type II ascorbate-dependent monooxygenase, C-terminal domain
MSIQTPACCKARVLVLAGLLLLAFSASATVSAADAPELATASLPGVDGRKVSLAAPPGGATVLVFYSSECPISNSYSPTLATLVDSFAAKPIKWVGVCVDPDLSNGEVETHARDFGLRLAVTRDRHGSFARKIGAKMTPEAFLIDSVGRIRYQGRIDDQFVARRVRNAAPSGSELKDAITAVLAGNPVKEPYVAAVGCPLPELAAAKLHPTYCKDVAPILQKYCQECHRPGQVGPFALETYDQVRKRATDIATVADDLSMPPWKAAPHFGVAFKDARTLSEHDIAMLVAWAEGGAPEGNRADLPPPAVFADDWQLGTPDLVIDIGTDYKVGAQGGDIYRCFVVPTSLDRDMYVSAVECSPGNRRVVHHILCYVDTSGKARERDLADPGPGYSCFAGPGEPVSGDLGGWAPGNRPSQLPEGVGRSLPRKSDVIIQVHYHPSGKAETDRTRIGLYFARKPIKQTLHWNAAANLEMQLPPGESAIEIKARWELPVDVVAYAVMPHMHLLGRDMMMSLKYPDGRAQELIKIDSWDFNWQYSYYFQEPIEIPKGTQLLVTAHFDNSASNPRNPNKPPKLVTWGEATTDEMCIGFLAVTKKDQDLTRPGEQDDLMEIVRKQADDYREKRDRSEKKAK